MDCQECNKRPATLHFTQIIYGNKTEVHVCEICAKEKGYTAYPEGAYSLHNLLSGLFNFDTSKIDNTNTEAFEQKKELKCPKCDLSFTQFKHIGKFGCATCYQTFSERLDPVLRRVHSGNTKHYGKIPKRKGGNLHMKKQLETYKIELQRLIEEEAFEEAAKIRDMIKSLKMSDDSSQPKAGDES